MVYWILTMSSLALAPLLYQLLQRRPLRHFELALFFTIAGLVVAHILPESIRLAGGAALGLFVVSWFLPTAFEKIAKRFEHEVHFVPIVFSMIGLLLHSVIDGLALATSRPGIWQALPIAVMLHSIPASLLVWWVMVPKFGRTAASLVLTGIGIATSVGFFSGGDWIRELSGTWEMGLFQAVVAGSLMHLASHRIQHDHHHH